MNYLSHYLLNEARGDTRPPLPWFTTGVMVPDLWPRHSRRRRIDPARVRSATPRSAEGTALQAGLLEHVAADAAFHGSEAFRRWRRALVPAAEALLERRSLASFLAHVGIELVLDRLLLHETPELGVEYYARLETVDPVRLATELDLLVGPAAAGFERLFHAFRQHRHLLGYSELPNVAGSIERIFALLGRGAPPPRPELLTFLERVEAALQAGPDRPNAPERWVSIAPEAV